MVPIPGGGVMPRIVAVELFELDLPFRNPFHHAAAKREHSESLFVRCVTDSGHCGFGETLPRPYVTGEERQEAFDMLAGQILPRLLELEFHLFSEVHDFLVHCDGKAPREWIEANTPQTSAWCLVDLALLDCFGRAFGTEVDRELAGRATEWPDGLAYGLVLSGNTGRGMLTTLVKARVYGIRDVKLKVEEDSLDGVRLARRILGKEATLRVDSNMAWSLEEASGCMTRMAPYGIESFEQPLPADDLDGLARLVTDTGLPVMADESFDDAASLQSLITRRACTAVNVRIAKCGGLVASLERCRRSLQAGLTLQIGCQVGETSLLSAAQMTLIRAVWQGVSFIEGCFGERLLRVDPVRPTLKFGRGGRPPSRPRGNGFGTEVDMRVVRRYARRRFAIGTANPTMVQGTR
ncbi:MAG: hypothetical protein GEU90_11480 [Gemmatimonas sp.]|nr:hypothetical protein [Gemmatimonas sp.]